MRDIAIKFVIVFGAILLLHFGRKPLRLLVQAFRRFSEHRWASIALCGILPIALRLALLPYFPAPEPAVHDEFSFLLAADTFLQGRLSNPPHPMWQHFETFHVIQQPTYASKYQPAQGAALALGWKLFGTPWAGVLITCGLMCAALCWMLQGWLPPAWALFGGLFAVGRYCVFTYWMNSYWGGAIPAFAGALVLGGLIRLKDRSSTSAAIAFGVGLSILALNRPYEGFLLGLLAGCTLLYWSYRNRRWAWVLPVGAILACLVGFQAYFNYRVTGSPTVMPYAIYEKEYSISSLFIFVKPAAPPVYRHPEMERFYREFDLEMYKDMSSDIWLSVYSKLLVLFMYYVQNWVMLVPLVAVPFLVLMPRARLPLAMFVAFFVGLALIKAILPHYAAPVTGLIIVLFILALHRIRLWNPQGKPTGSLLARVVIIAITANFAYWCIHLRTVDLTGDSDFKAARKKLIAELNARPEPQLVIVRYTPKHFLHSEWVYNAADIDNAHIVWARDMGSARNAELTQYFHNRTVSVLEPDDGIKLAPYSSESAKALPSH